VWAEVRGDWGVVTNEAGCPVTIDAPTLARHETSLSTDDHKASVDVTAWASNGQGGPCARFSNDAAPNEDLYYCNIANEVTDHLYFFKIVNGTITGLDTGTTPTIGLPDTVEIECDGSAMKSRFNGTLNHDFSDTSITGNLKCGMNGRRTADRLDNFSAQDLAAAGDGLIPGRLQPMGIIW